MNITPIFEALAMLLYAAVAAVAIPFIKARTTADQQQQINTWVKIAVAAVEQTCKDAKGPEKKKKVLDWLHDHNITVDESQLDAMIEAAVYELKSGFLPVGSGVLMESEGAYGIG